MESERTTKNRQYCIAIGCNNSNKKNPQFHFFSLPKSEDRRKQWLTNLQREDLLNKTDLKHKSYVVCSAHFDESQIRTMKHLKTDAVPKDVNVDEVMQESANPPSPSLSPSEHRPGSLSLLRNILMTVKPGKRSVKTQTDSTLDTHAAEYLADLRMMKRVLQREYSDCTAKKLARLQQSEVLVITCDGGGGNYSCSSNGGGYIPAPQHIDPNNSVTIKVEKDLLHYKLELDQ